MIPEATEKTDGFEYPVTMCLYSGCAKPDAIATLKWRVGRLCYDHLLELGARYGRNDGVPAFLVADYIKIHVLLQLNVLRCVRHFEKLELQLQVSSKQPRNDLDPRFAKNSTDYVKLSRALEYYEGYCWFPANRPLLAGLLSSEAFQQATEMGFNKDPGAGIRHGDQAHRIQWHTIMREVTQHFTTPIDRDGGWSHSPLELYYKMTHDESNAAGIWGKLLDKNDHDGWGSPDRLMVSLRTSGLTMISTALDRRVTKHGGTKLDQSSRKPNVGNWQAAKSIRDKNISNQVDVILNLISQTNQLDRYLLKLDGPVKQRGQLKMAIEGTIYLWEKVGFPVRQPNNDTIEFLAFKAYKLVLKHFPATFNNATVHYQVLNGTPLHKQAPDTGVRIDAGRINNSKNGFNTACYQYSAALGASPAIGQNNRW